MKLAIAAICILALMGSAVAGETCRGVPMPPLEKRAEPNVPYSIKWVPHSAVAKRCAVANYPAPAACAFSDPTAKSAAAWTILIRDDLPKSEQTCVLIYEKSHLPPNLWENLFLFSPSERAAWLKSVNDYRAWEAAQR